MAIVEVGTPPRSTAPATTPAPSPDRTVRWVLTLFVASVVTQRLAVPGTAIPLLLAIVGVWIAAALVARVVELDPRRATWWALATVATGTVVLLGPGAVVAPQASLASWALVLMVSATLTVRLVERGRDTYLRVLRGVCTTGLVLAGGALVMTATQLVGLRYRDLVAAVVPDALLLPGYVITYPYAYESPLYRANAWIGLEPSFVSFQLGLALLAAVLLRRSVRVVLVLAAGLVTTASGSGILVVLVGLLALATWPRRAVLTRYLPLAAVGVTALLATPFGRSLAARAGEVTDADSSASLRAVSPYVRLFPRWFADLPTMLLGAGPGSSQQLVTASGDNGLLVPTPVKIFFDYGLLAGAVLAALIVASYRRGPSAAIALSLFVSLWTVQPGLTTILLVVDVVLLVSAWSPRDAARLENAPARPGRPVP